MLQTLICTTTNTSMNMSTSTSMAMSSNTATNRTLPAARSPVVIAKVPVTSQQTVATTNTATAAPSATQPRARLAEIARAAANKLNPHNNF